jgi:FKBP-type peptidyl-prolyl cis-trans isomerase SlyD
MITKDKVVAMTYILKDEDGNILDESGNESFEFLQGHQNIIPGLEKALNGLNPGDRKNVEVSPDEAYGEYDPELRFSIEKQQFGGQSPESGMMIQLTSPQGQPFVASVVEVDDKLVHLDANHPLAGKKLHFAVEIVNVRDASEEELAHGHVHGPHGHHH